MTMPAMPIARDVLSPLRAHNSRNCSKPVSATLPPVSHKVPHNALRAAICIEIRAGSSGPSLPATWRARCQLVLAAARSRLVDHFPERTCQSKAACRSPAASRCSAMSAAFWSVEPGLFSWIATATPPVQLGPGCPELRLVRHRSDERMPERVLGVWGEPHLVDEIDSQQFGDGVVRSARLVQNGAQ